MASAAVGPTTGWAQGVQQLLDVSFNDVAPWLGLGLASAWLYDGKRVNANALLPRESPVHWLGRTAHGLGLSQHWAVLINSWLHRHSIVFPILLAVAVFSAGGSTRVPFKRANLTLLPLLAAISVRSSGLTILLFLAASSALSVGSYAADALIYEAYAKGTTERWLNGPFLTVTAVAFAPLGLLFAAIRHYQGPRKAMPTYGLELESELEDMRSGTLSEMPAEVALRFIAKTMLVAAEPTQRRLGLVSLSRKNPSGARFKW